ncbi:MAG: heavy-metal-associated domain-containing protein [Eggerthellaceae bacterium]
MMCVRCVAHVKKALEAVDGVASTEVDLKRSARQWRSTAMSPTRRSWPPWSRRAASLHGVALPSIGIRAIALFPMRVRPRRSCGVRA